MPGVHVLGTLVNKLQFFLDAKASSDWGYESKGESDH